MISKRSSSWTVALGVSLTALACGALALFQAGVVADENNLASSFSPLLWSIFGLGILGTLVTLPGWLASKRQGRGQLATA